MATFWKKRSRRRLAWLVSLVLCQKSFAFRPPLVSEELGCSPTLSFLMSGGSRSEKFYFDPLNLCNDKNFSRFREAELKHGRVSMIAIAGTMLTPALKRLTDWIPDNYPNGVLAVIKSADYVKVIVVCGILDTVIFVQKDPRDMPGDYGTGWLGIRDKGLHEKELIAELENGRLAMLAIAGQVIAEIYSGETWEEHWMAEVLKWIDGFR